MHDLLRYREKEARSVIGTTTGTPGYFFATTLPRGKTSLGVGVLKVNLEGLQPHPSSAVGDVMIVDENGVIVLASRPAWQYRTMTQLTPAALATLRDARQYENVELARIGIKTEEAKRSARQALGLALDFLPVTRPQFTLVIANVFCRPMRQTRFIWKTCSTSVGRMRPIERSETKQFRLGKRRVVLRLASGLEKGK